MKRRTLKAKSPAFPIWNLDQLEAALRSGARLLKTITRGGPVFEVANRRVDPTIARAAIEGGAVRPLDPGLFGEGDEQSWHLWVPRHRR